MSDTSKRANEPAWLVTAGAAEGWGEREWRGWERIHDRLDELGPFDLEATDPETSGIGAYGGKGTFFETVNYEERVPLYEAVHRLVKKINFELEMKDR
jgi:hypothetical protein